MVEGCEEKGAGEVGGEGGPCRDRGGPRTMNFSCFECAEAGGIFYLNKYYNST